MSVVLAVCRVQGNTPQGFLVVGVVWRNTAGRWTCILGGSIPEPALGCCEDVFKLWMDAIEQHSRSDKQPLLVALGCSELQCIAVGHTPGMRTVYADGHAPPHAPCTVAYSLHHSCASLLLVLQHTDSASIPQTQPKHQVPHKTSAFNTKTLFTPQAAIKHDVTNFSSFAQTLERDHSSALPPPQWRRAGVGGGVKRCVGPLQVPRSAHRLVGCGTRCWDAPYSKLDSA